MNYFYSVLLWISPVTVDIQKTQKRSGWVARLLAFVVFEEFHLAQPLLRLCARLVRPAKIFTLLLRYHFVARFYFFYHSLPSCTQFRALRLPVQYPCCCRKFAVANPT